MSDQPFAALNAAVLAFTAGKQAHSDVGAKLLEAAQDLGAVEVGGDLRRFEAPRLSTAGIIFAGATGMALLHLRLPPPLAERAVRCGADPSPIGAGWAQFTLFRADWPEIDLPFWTRKAYAHAHDLAAGR